MKNQFQQDSIQFRNNSTVHHLLLARRHLFQAGFDPMSDKVTRELKRVFVELKAAESSHAKDESDTVNLSSATKPNLSA